MVVGASPRLVDKLEIGIVGEVVDQVVLPEISMNGDCFRHRPSLPSVLMTVLHSDA
jgi:hypothetical protein